MEELKAFLMACQSIYEAFDPDRNVDDTAYYFVEAYSAYKDALTARTLAIVQDGTCHDERG